MTSRFGMVPVDKIIVSNHKGVQRAEGVSESRARKIADEWDMAKVGTLSLSDRRDGTYFAVDGAHRTVAARINGVTHLPAIVHENLTRVEEAQMFEGLNDFKQPSAVSRFIARVEGGDAGARAIRDVIEAHGWKVSLSSEDGNLSAITAAERVYETAASTLPRGEYKDVLDWTLDVITASWGHDRHGVNAHVLLGLAQLNGRFGGGVDTKKLVSELALTRPKVLVGHAKTLRDAMGGTVPAHVAKVLVGMHNKKRRTNLLPEWVWTR